MDAATEEKVEQPVSPDELAIEIDGTRYPFPANFTFWEARWVKELTGLAMGDFIRAGLREDPDTTYAYAAVAMLRATTLSLTPEQIKRILDEKQLGSVRVFDPGAQTSPPALAADEAAKDESPIPTGLTLSTSETLEPSGAPI